MSNESTKGAPPARPSAGTTGSSGSAPLSSAQKTPAAISPATVPHPSNAAPSAGLAQLSTGQAPAAEEPGPKERILQAALELFVEQGYFNTNVPDISKRSRCSVGSIYHHFLNKEEIAAKLYDSGIKRFRHALASVVTPDQHLEQNIRSIVIAFLEFAESHLLLSRYLWLARHNEFLNADLRHPTTVGFDELGRKLTRMIKQGERAGQIPPLQAEVLWSILFGMPLSYVRDWLDGYTVGSPKAVSSVLASACWSALQGTGQPGTVTAEAGQSAAAPAKDKARSKKPKKS